MGLPSKVPLVFGDITATVKLVTAVDTEASGLKMVCNDGHPPAKVKMPAICTHEPCGKEGNRYSFPRAKETENGLVVLTQEEIKEAQGDAPKQIVVTVHPLQDVLDSTFPGESQYLLTPSDAISVEAYSMIRQALVDNPDVALVAVYAVQSSPKMWRVGVFEDALCLTELAWPETVKARPAIPKVTVVDELRAMATVWVETFTQPFDPAAYRDTAKAARDELVAAKAGTAVPLQALPEKVPANVSMSLLERLKASVAEVEATKAEATPPPAKKAAAKKPAAKRTARKTA